MAKVFRGYIISCLSMFSFTVFKGANWSFLREIFLIEKPSRSVLNWVIYIGVIRIALYLTFNLFRSIQSKAFFYSPLLSVRLECVQVLGDFGRDVWVVLTWRLVYVFATRVSGKTKLHVWRSHVWITCATNSTRVSKSVAEILLRYVIIFTPQLGQRWFST